MTAISGHSGDEFGFSVSGAGDVNGDGFDDVVIGERFGSTNTRGVSYVIYGSDEMPRSIRVAVLTSNVGVEYFGGEFDRFGSSVSGVGDFNGDGLDDFMMGGPQGDGASNGLSDAGDSRIVFGSTTGPGGFGVSIHGARAGHHTGASVSGAGDINGDGYDDVITGAFDDGDAFVIYGRDFSSRVTHEGTAVGETLTGSSATDDVIVGGEGDDELVGNGGNDVLRGGEGDDVLAVGDPNFKRVVGGNGLDTLRLDASGVLLDLVALPDNRIIDVERIDLSGSGANTLKLSVDDVRTISDESNVLLVMRDADDTVISGDGWTPADDEVIDGETFQVLTRGVVTLKVQKHPLIVDLAPLNEATGIRIDGEDSFDGSGRSVSGAGDVNGDGFEDLLIGATGADGTGNSVVDAGATYLIFGGDLLGDTLDLAALGEGGVKIIGSDAGDLSGVAVSGVGDVNGDGFDDVLIGASEADADGNRQNFRRRKLPDLRRSRAAE